MSKNVNDFIKYLSVKNDVPQNCNAETLAWKQIFEIFDEYKALIEKVAGIKSGAYSKPLDTYFENEEQKQFLQTKVDVWADNGFKKYARIFDDSIELVVPYNYALHNTMPDTELMLSNIINNRRKYFLLTSKLVFNKGKQNNANEPELDEILDMSLTAEQIANREYLIEQRDNTTKLLKELLLKDRNQGLADLEKMIANELLENKKYAIFKQTIETDSSLTRVLNLFVQDDSAILKFAQIKAKFEVEKLKKSGEVKKMAEQQYVEYFQAECTKLANKIKFLEQVLTIPQEDCFMIKQYLTGCYNLQKFEKEIRFERKETVDQILKNPDYSFKSFLQFLSDSHSIDCKKAFEPFFDRVKSKEDLQQMVFKHYKFACTKLMNELQTDEELAEMLGCKHQTNQLEIEL